MNIDRDTEKTLEEIHRRTLAMFGKEPAPGAYEDDLTIPDFLRIDAETRKAAWLEFKPPQPVDTTSPGLTVEERADRLERRARRRLRAEIKDLTAQRDLMIGRCHQSLIDKLESKITEAQRQLYLVS